MLLFCLSLGGIGYLLCSLFHSEKCNRICGAVILFLTALPYLIEYFVFRKFLVLYDLNTVFAGAADAVGGFAGDIFEMVFSFSGMLRIVLYLLPSLLLLLFGRYLHFPQQATRHQRILAAIAMIGALAAGILGICLSPSLSTMWGGQYYFGTAVENFGLMPAVGRDLWEICTDSSNDDFALDVPAVTQATEATEASTTAAEQATVPDVTEQTIPVTEPEEVVVEYGLNQLDIDFASLESSVSKITSLNEYVASLTPSSQNEFTGLFAGKNLILITAEAFTLESIDPVLTPTLYRLYSKGIQFTDYYQFAGSGTTGGEYQNIFGMIPTDGGQSFKNTEDNYNYYTIGSMLDRLGYYGQAFHNNSYTYYSRHRTHNNIGYSAGFMGYGNGIEEYVDDTWPQSDLQMIQGTLPLYIENQPFNIYYMTVSGHSRYSTYDNFIAYQNWSRVSDLSYSKAVRAYLATQLELEDAMACLVEQLEDAGIADNTVICLTTDHFPYGLDSGAYYGNMTNLSELYGYDVRNIFQRDHNCWLLWCGSLEENDPIVVDTPTFSLDILPTLANLFGVEYDSRLLPGRDVFSDADALVFSPTYDWKTEYGSYDASYAKFTQTDESVVLPENYVSTISSIVKNKITYCSRVLEYDYFRYLFEDVS